MADAIRRLIKPIASLRLTVLLLAMGIVLIFFGTLAQRDQGIWSVQKQFFHSLIIWVKGVPLPGGLTIGGLMLVNLLAAHITRFKFTWKRSGILLIHAGVIMLLVGELVTTLFAVEMQMRIDQGQTAYYANDIRENELAVIDTSDPKEDHVVAFPQAALREGATLRYGSVPFEIHVDRYLMNSELVGPMQKVPDTLHLADHGDGAKVGIVAMPDETDPDRINAASAYVTLEARGRRLGTWLVSLHLGPQPVELDGKTYFVALRFRRHYQPFTVQLLKFTHANYPGTDIPKNFSSRIRLVDPRPGHNTDRETLIYMNAPLRYDGKTFYQSGFDNNDATTILQVVDNPGMALPYVACTMVGLGMLIHFTMALGRFLKKGAA